jgi:hypothetical protein
MKCPICEARKPRRSCPAKSARICSVCCATKREVEIDCPISCGYLREGYSYSQERTPPMKKAAEQKSGETFDHSFLINNEQHLMDIWKSIWESFKSVPQIHDDDVLGALASLQKTLETLEKGLYYDSSPADSLQQYLYTRIKTLLEEKMQNPDLQQSHLKVSTAIQCLSFLQHYARMKSSGKPLSRGFLMELDSIFSKLPTSPPIDEPRVTLE